MKISVLVCSHTGTGEGVTFAHQTYENETVVELVERLLLRSGKSDHIELRIIDQGVRHD